VTPPELLTARLRLRPRTPADLEANLAMDLDPEVHRYIFPQGIPDAAVYRAELLRRITTPPPQGGRWVVEWRREPGFLGWCGIIPLEGSGLIELGYRYRRAAWGRGIATEAARAVLAHGFEALRLDPIVAVAHPDNLASRRVLAKLGFQHEGPAHYYGTEVAFYRLGRGRYLAGRVQPPAGAGSERD
jgi:RimJ/RimL family protein N-acetyltransferase